MPCAARLLFIVQFSCGIIHAQSALLGLARRCGGPQLACCWDLTTSLAMLACASGDTIVCTGMRGERGEGRGHGSAAVQHGGSAAQHQPGRHGSVRGSL
eukprot:5357028-Prymnesium_polylepis.1